MIRSTIDAPAFRSDPVAGEDHRAIGGVFSQELELWIEVLLLIGVGLVMVYSASSIMALKKFGDASHFFRRQIACIILGIGALLAASRFSYRNY
ncbi:MAG TPA: FtsW/RodA/SpoVE family cell cycle protein, partial [Syntrophobacteraceae bacterium]|nr:FtsW/RodA/SpoVE family cell cycle protein [Syntrophobacteraceae bacterium]